MGKSSCGLLVGIAPEGVAETVVGDSKVSLAKQDCVHVLRVPAAMTPTLVKVLMAKGPAEDYSAFAKTSHEQKPLTEYRPEVLKTTTTFGKNEAPSSLDDLGQIPWHHRSFPTGFRPHGPLALLARAKP